MHGLPQTETRYAKSGTINIAYQVIGDGPIDLVFIPGWVSHVEMFWSIPEQATFMHNLAEFARVIILDRRGTGLSDPVPLPPTIEERMDDVRAVMDAERWTNAAIWGIGEGGPMAIVFAATHPQSTRALILHETFPRLARAPDYPHGLPPKLVNWWLDHVETNWGTGRISETFAPNHTQNTTLIQNLARLERMSMSPGTARKQEALLFHTDVRHVLPAISTPTLVLHCAGDTAIRVEHGRYLAEHIPGAKYVELPGEDFLPFLGGANAILAEVREFLIGERPTPILDRVLATILFCDIVDSTAKAAQLGDHQWKNTLQRFYQLTNEKLALYHGRILDTAGDGLFAAFDGPARAARCGADLCDAVQTLGLHLRVGVHTGECEVLAGKYSGIAVHIGARAAATAGPGEVVVTSTVKDLSAGSGIPFDELGPHTLKGIPGQWRLYRTHPAP